MSRSVVWKPVKPNAAMSLGAKSTPGFIQDFEKVFGSMPVILNQSDIPRLEVIAALNSDESGWTRCVDLIREFNAIEVAIEW